MTHHCMTHRLYSVSSEPNPPGRPLFAAGSIAIPPVQPPPMPSGGVGDSVGKVISSSANSKIIHPEEDVSLEELKAKKYKHLGTRTTIYFRLCSLSTSGYILII